LSEHQDHLHSGHLSRSQFRLVCKVIQTSTSWREETDSGVACIFKRSKLIATLSTKANFSFIYRKQKVQLIIMDSVARIKVQFPLANRSQHSIGLTTKVLSSITSTRKRRRRRKTLHTESK